MRYEVVTHREIKGGGILHNNTGCKRSDAPVAVFWAAIRPRSCTLLLSGAAFVLRATKVAVPRKRDRSP